MADLMTTGQIATQFNVTRDRVIYVISDRGIEHEHEAGGYRLYSPEQVEQIKRELPPKKRGRCRS